MTLYVHITEECRTGAQDLDLEPRLIKIKEQIETAQNLSGFDFLSATLLKKKIGRPFRLIAWRHAIADDELIIFVRLLQRRLADYPSQLQAIKDTPKPYSNDELKQIYYRLTIKDSDLDDYPKVMTPKEDKAEQPAEMDNSFWDSPDLDALARSQNVEPLSDIRELYGTWPGDESDGFEEEIDALRHYGHEDP